MQQIQGQVEPVSGGSPITNIPCQQTHPELSQDLLLVAESQDRQAFTRLFKFFAPKIKRFGIKQYNNESQANELVQNTMANVWRKAALFNQEKGAATTWIYSVMRNASFDMLRKSKGHTEQNLGDDIWPLEQAMADSDDQQALFKDHLMSRHLEKLVESLPDAQRVVVQGVYFQELSQEQLSQQLGVPIGTIKSRLRLALEKIRQQMGEQHYD